MEGVIPMVKRIRETILRMASKTDVDSSEPAAPEAQSERSIGRWVLAGEHNRRIEIAEIVLDNEAALIESGIEGYTYVPAMRFVFSDRDNGWKAMLRVDLDEIKRLLIEFGANQLGEIVGEPIITRSYTRKLANGSTERKTAFFKPDGTNLRISSFDPPI